MMWRDLKKKRPFPLFYVLQVDVDRYITVNPLDPVQPLPDSALLGSWTLAYASNGVGVSDGEPRQPLNAAPFQANILAQVSLPIFPVEHNILH